MSLLNLPSSEDIISTRILPNLGENEKLVGVFLAYSIPPFAIFVIFSSLLSGLLSSFSRNTYLIAVTDYGLHIFETTLLLEVKQHKFLKWAEIDKFNIKKKLLNYYISLESNNTKMKFKVPTFGGQRSLAIDQNTAEFLKSKSTF